MKETEGKEKRIWEVKEDETKEKKGIGLDKEEGVEGNDREA